MLDTVVALSSLWVSVCYIIIGLLIVPNLNFPVWATVMGALFFVGCALTHAHIAADAFEPPIVVAAHAYIMIVLHVIQGIGGTGFIVAISTKRVIVRLEES